VGEAVPGMEIRSTEIHEVKLLEPRRHGDERGFFSETYRRDVFSEAGIGDVFVQENHSMSATAGTLRGLHFQSSPHAQAKVVRVVHGAIYDVAVDIRASSPTFGQHVAVELSAKNWRQIYIPVGFAHGMLTLEPNTEVVYLVSDYYSPEDDRGLLWCDKELAIDWPLGGQAPLLSQRDQTHPVLRDLPAYF
jgi:dTDP-4-dehydrorhamnose 3,5-epimerase